MQKTIENRTVTPQFKTEDKAKSNLAEHAVKCSVFNAENVVPVCQQFAAAMAEVMNGQCSIKFLGPVFTDRVLEAVIGKRGEDESLVAFRARCPLAQQEGEKQLAHYTRVYDACKLAAVEVAKEEFDFIAMFTTWATTTFMREKKDVRQSLTNYDGSLAVIRKLWSEEEKRPVILTRLSLPDELAAGDLADVIAAFEAKYKPAVEISLEELV